MNNLPMKRAIAVILLAGSVLCVESAPASAQRLIASLSNHRVMVTSSFTGADLVLFGYIETATPRRGGYDIVATISGPRQDAVTFRKARRVGIWLNVDSREFDNVPTYLAVLANRELDAIASADTRRRLQIGIENIPLTQRAAVTIADAAADDPFRKAFVRINEQRGLYREAANGITFLAPLLFRADIPLPAGVSVGNYEVDVRLFADGALVARAPSAFEVYKAGFEQFVTSSARSHGLLFGLFTAMMTLATGWLGSVIFRRD
ncbi:MAG TPA: TIGR02186 family protein [Xanthobacteraceae bacterium]|nr:TIGR02186 family protein [Xanthobacteraceae bacterium]